VLEKTIEQFLIDQLMRRKLTWTAIWKWLSERMYSTNTETINLYGMTWNDKMANHVTGDIEWKSKTCFVVHEHREYMRVHVWLIDDWCASEELLRRKIIVCLKIKVENPMT
jgi:hypothetical protein